VRTTRQFQIEASLPDAIANGEIEVYFQPIMDTVRDCIAGFEALARWRHPNWAPYRRPSSSALPPARAISARSRNACCARPAQPFCRT
jgi:EAL domain-containing protein (putative c-di-GMP-specific phosphodiesterase class I)